LNPGVDRCAFSVIVRMKADGTFDDQHTWFGRTLINNKCRMDYQTAQDIIDGKVTAQSGMPAKYPLHNAHGSTFTDSDVIAGINTLKDLAAELHKMGKKTETGGDVKMGFEIDPATGLPTGFKWR